MSKYMKSLYISTSGDTTLELPVPFEVDGCVCGIIEMSGKLSTYKGDIFYAQTFVKSLLQEKLLCLYCERLNEDLMDLL